MDIRKIISTAPSTPGVYIFKDKRKRILYIGKAANLRARLKSYAQPGWKEDMLKEARLLAWEELSSDIEALIRESELVKKHRPKFNILLRDDKNYFYVAFTKDIFPRIYLTHQPHGKASPRLKTTATYIGPFTEGEPIKKVLKLLRATFPYCTCSTHMLHKRRCVNAEIGKCLGFCCTDMPTSKSDRARYMANISAIKKVLNGKTRSLAKSLEKKMTTLANAQRYEQARLVRNQLLSLARIFEHSPFLQNDMASERNKGLRTLQELLQVDRLPERIEGYDISHHQGSSTVASMVVFHNGMPQKSEYRKFIIKSVDGVDDFASLAETITRRLNHPEWPMPDIMLIDGGRGQLSAVKMVLDKTAKENTIFRGASEPSGLSVRKSVFSEVVLISIAKREEELYTTTHEEPFKLKQLPAPLLHLITHIRDEAHRFAISFHRKRSRGRAF